MATCSLRINWLKEHPTYGVLRRSFYLLIAAHIPTVNLESQHIKRLPFFHWCLCWQYNCKGGTVCVDMNVTYNPLLGVKQIGHSDWHIPYWYYYHKGPLLAVQQTDHSEWHMHISGFCYTSLVSGNIFTIQTNKFTSSLRLQQCIAQKCQPTMNMM